MLKKIQSSGSGAQQSPPVAVGEFQNAETVPPPVPSGSDSAAETEKIQTSAGNCGNGCSACSTGDHPCGRCGFFAGVVIFFIRIYQKLIAPLLPDCCRFEPTCSRYAKQALQNHSFLKAILLISKRLLKCHPWGGCGYDPVPPAKEKRKK